MDPNEIELTVDRAIIDIPENAVEVIVTAKVYMDGKIQEVSRTYDMKEVREMIRKADEGYIDDDDRLCITEKGLAWLEEQEALKNN